MKLDGYAGCPNPACDAIDIEASVPMWWKLDDDKATITEVGDSQFITFRCGACGYTIEDSEVPVAAQNQLAKALDALDTILGIST